MRRQFLRLVAQRLHFLALANRRHDVLHFHFAVPPDALPLVYRSLHRPQELGQRQRFFDKIESAEAGGLDRGFHRAMTGHHDHRTSQGLAVRPFAQQGDAIGSGHPDVQKHKIGLVIDPGRPRFVSIGGNRDLVALLAENFLQQRPDIQFVVDNQNLWITHALSLLTSPRRCSIMACRAVSLTGNKTRTSAPPSL